jgi:UDP-N-acetylglucosamine acyltransferase
MGISEKAIISPKARIDKDVEVGPFSVIEDNVSIKKGTKIGSHCVITGNTTLGENNTVYTGAVIGSQAQDLKYKGEKSFLEIGNNNLIREYVTINSGTGEGSKTVIGNNNSILAYSHIAHDCIVGNGILMANLATLAGHVTVEDRAVIGGLAAAHQFVRIGELAILGGCSKVVQDVPPYMTADGHPAKIRGINKIGLERAGIDVKARSNLRKAYFIIFRSELIRKNAVEKVKKELPQSDEISRLLKFIEGSKRGLCG